MAHNIEVANMNQKAVLYAANGYDDYGEPKVAAAVEIDVRWLTGRRESIDAQGNTIALDSQAVVDRNIPIGSALWLGALADIPSPVTDLQTVIDYQETPDIKARNFRRTITLAKLSDELPGLA